MEHWKKNLQVPIDNLIQFHQSDILILLEANENDNSILVNDDYNFHRSNSRKVLFFSKFPEHIFRVIKEEPHYTARVLSLSGMEEILLIGVHLSR